MKILRSIYALLALILVNMTYSMLKRTHDCSHCKASEYCDVGNTCHAKHKKGEACTKSRAQGGTSVENCVDGTSCKENPVTHKLRCD